MGANTYTLLNMVSFQSNAHCLQFQLLLLGGGGHHQFSIGVTKDEVIGLQTYVLSILDLAVCVDIKEAATGSFCSTIVKFQYCPF